MTIHRPYLLAISGLFLAVGAVLLAWRIVFWVNAVETQATVVRIDAADEWCNEGLPGHRWPHDTYPCTRYSAVLEYRVRDQRFRTTGQAGEVRGHRRPKELAALREGGQAPVVYFALDPATAYLDTPREIWTLPFLALAASLVFLAGSFFPSRWR